MAGDCKAAADNEFGFVWFFQANQESRLHSRPNRKTNLQVRTQERGAVHALAGCAPQGTRFVMFAFDRSAFTVLAPLALLALAIAVSNYSPAPQPAQAMQQNSEKPGSEKPGSDERIAVVARNNRAVTRH
jgi:hypothetical protein